MKQAYAAKALALWLLSTLAAHTHAATVEGRVIHPQRSDAAADLEVVLLGVSQEGEPIERRTRTDARGRFRVSALPTPAAYLVAATYRDITFPGGSVVFREEAPEETRELVFHIYDSSTDGTRLVLRKMRWVIEREAGAYRVSQSFVVANPGLNVILRESAQPPLLRVGLAPGHGELETPFGTLPIGAQLRDGLLELRGPFYPGEREVQLAYDLPETGLDLSTQIRVPDPLQMLEVFVRDFGIRVDAGPLHPARPTREGDVIYQRYLGFDLAAGTRIPFRVEALPPRAPTAAWAEMLAAALAAAGLLYFVGRPIGRAEPHPAASEESAETSEREALITALSDLEHDFETGKLSSEDRERLRQDLRREAVRALSRARGAQSAAETTAAKPCRCGRMPALDDRFCATCGSPL